MSQLETIATAVPSVAPPPMVRHVVERVPDPDRVDGPFKPTEFKERTLCGQLWDRPLPSTPGPICDACAFELSMRGGSLTPGGGS